MQKFGFTIKTRDGQIVENLFIAGRDQAEAERKLRQMYLNCHVVRCSTVQVEMRRGHHHAMDVEELLSLIARESSSAIR